MKNEDILKKFVKECVNKLNLKSVIKFGSSTYSKNFKDIDLMFVFNDDVIKTSDSLKLRQLIREFEKKNRNIVFDFGGVGTRKRKTKYSVTVVSFGLKDLQIKYNPHDLFFLKLLELDKNLKILHGTNPFKNSNISLTKQHLFEMLSVDLKHALRNNLESVDKDSLYHLFKTFLRAMLIEYGFFEKEELLQEFNKRFKGKIKLPRNPKRIILGEIKEEDFKAIIDFAENCLEYLSK
ncbi:MAG: hypothetical protein AABY15_08775 [Nanoarchaeota archaeon]